METKRQDNETNIEEKQKSSGAAREILSWVLTFALAIGAAFLIKNYLIINADVPTINGKYDHAGRPSDRKPSGIFKEHTGARGCCDLPLSG